MSHIYRSAIESLRLRGPLAADPTARTLHALLAGVLVFDTIAYFVQRPFSPNKPVSMLNMLLLAAAITGALVLLRRGALRAASLTYLMMMWIFASIVVWVAGGIRTFGVAYYLALPILAAWLLGYQAALWNVALSLGATLLFAIAETLGFWRFPTPTPFGAWIHLTQATIIAAVPAAHILRSLRDALSESRDSQQALQRSRQHLEDLVEQLRASELKYRRLHESISDAVATVDMTGRILESNHAFEVLLGYTGEELRRLTYQDITPDEWHGFEARIVAEQVLPHGHSGVYEKEYRRRDGAVLPIELRTFLLGNEKGQPIGMWAIVRDITERKRAEAALRESERQLTSIYNTVHDIIFHLAVEPEGQFRFVSVNAGFLRATGLSRQNVVGRTVDEVIPQPSLKTVLEMYRQAVEQKTVVCWEETSDYPTGRLTGEVSVAPVFDDKGTCTHLVGSVHDITERKRTDEERERLRLQLAQAQRLESIGRLAGGIAHDFNNLMGVVLLNVDSAREELESGESAAESIAAIREGAEKAIVIGQQLMAFGSKQVLEPEVLDLNAVIAENQRLVRRLIGEDIKVLFKPASQLGLVKADRGQLAQVIMNLAVNSRDAMPQGGTFVIETSEVELHKENAELNPDAMPGSYVVMSVADTGVGIDKETRARVFEPFFTTKDVGKGSGLGLSVVYGIVKQSGGFITVVSEPDQGAEFRIYLPVVQEMLKPIPHIEEEPMQKGSETILLVEDELALREKLRDILADAGYGVITARDGIQALRLAGEEIQPIHLLLTDVVMPELSGPSLAERLANCRPAMKVLYMSGYPNTTDARRDMQGSTDFMQKPFTKQQLLRRVRRVLDTNTFQS